MDAKRCAVAHPEIKFGQITGQMLLTHMLISPDQAPLENGEKALGGMAAGRSCFALTGICLVTVSYTHLDVYKRQGFIRWRIARGYEVTPFKREFWGKKGWHKTHPRMGWQ